LFESIALQALQRRQARRIGEQQRAAVVEVAT
jgi:hypothetical protein